jgi:site-specific recombinase XerD
MNLTGSILNYRRYLKRKNYSSHTVKNYLHRLQTFIAQMPIPIESAKPEHVKHYIDFMLEQNLSPQTINAHIVVIRMFYNYLREEEEIEIKNPVVRGMMLRVAKPLPRHLRDSDLPILFDAVTRCRDTAIFMLMLRCGLRVEEVANLTLGAIDYQRNQIFVKSGKGAKDRIVYISNDASDALASYLRKRLRTNEQKVFLVEKGTHQGKPMSVRGIQKRIEYYAKKSGIAVSCHQLRHTMATQLLNADADLVTIQCLLGHTRIKTTMRYCHLSNIKAQRDYYEAVARVIEKSKKDVITWGLR